MLSCSAPDSTSNAGVTWIGKMIPMKTRTSNDRLSSPTILLLIWNAPPFLARPLQIRGDSKRWLLRLGSPALHPEPKMAVRQQGRLPQHWLCCVNSVNTDPS
jgi:hypothetical protein